MVSAFSHSTMATRKKELEERRARVLALQHNATRKVKRLQSKGIDIEDTQHDVRRDPSHVSRYNTRQLDALEGKLTSFNSRSNAFYKGANNTIITAAAWRELKHTERLVNARGDRWQKSVGSVFIEQSGMTVAERNEGLRTKRIRAKGESTPRLYVHNNRKPSEVNGMKAVESLIKQQKSRLKRDYVHKEVKKGRKSFTAMLKKMDMTDQLKDLRALSDHQFAILVKETNFSAELGLNYEAMEMLSSDSKNRALSSVVNDSSEMINGYLKSAKKYPKTSKQSKTGPSS